MVEPLFEEDRVADTEAQKSLWRILSLLWSFRYVFLVSILLCLILGYLYLKSSVPIYEAEASVMVEETGSMGKESLFFQDLGIGKGVSSVDNEVEILKSKSLLRQAVRDLDLQFRYWNPGFLRDNEAYGSNLPFKLTLVSLEKEGSAAMTMEVRRKEEGYLLEWEGKARPMELGSTLEMPFGIIRIDKGPKLQDRQENERWKVQWMPNKQAGNRFLKALTVAPINNKVNFIKLRLLDPIPERAEDLINQLIHVYLASSIEEKNRAAESTLEFIDERLEIVSKDLREIESQFETFKTSRSIMDLSEQSKQLIEESHFMKKALLDQEVQLQLLESLDKFISEPSRSNDQIPLGLGTMDPGLTEIVKHYNQLQQVRAHTAMAFTDQSPQMEHIDKQIQAVRSQVVQHVDSRKKNLQTRVQRMQSSAEDMESMIQSVPGTERAFMEIYRQQKIKQELYMYLLKMWEETALSRSSTLAGARMIDAAERQGGPVRPVPSRIYMASLALGILIPSSFLLGRELLNRRIQGRDDVERRTRIPMLGMISEAKAPLPMVVGPGSKSIVAEQFRTVRTNLQFFQSGPDDQVLLVSSSMSGEGKSFVSMNLAATLALSEKKVLLVELDMRKPRMSKDLGMEQGQGISHYLIGKSTWKDILLKDKLTPGLDFIAAGYLPPNPAELLLSPKMEVFLREARQNYDFILLDTAPVGLVTDAQILAKLADIHLFVVRDRYTYKQQIEQLESLYIQSKFETMGLILNGMPASMSGYYGVKKKEGNGYFDV